MVSLNWSLQKIAEITHGHLLGDGAVIVRKIVIDSRINVDEALFIAIPGDRFDGHDFVGDVAARGALAAIVETPIPNVPIAQIVVDDTISSLQSLGLARRLEFPGKVVAITGSSGKTTTRRMVQSILSEKFCTHQPKKNFNNHIGVPLTLLELDDIHEACVLELGCSDFGEIETLTTISDPDIALITNVGPAHLEKLGDLRGVARAKGELFASTRKEAIAVVNLDDPRVATMPTNPETTLGFGTGEGTEVRLIKRIPAGLSGQKLVLDLKGDRMECVVPLVGIHNAANATAAIAVALSLGIEKEAMANGLANVTAEPGRLSLLRGPRQSIIIDDTYNANPASMKAAIKTLVDLGTGGRTVAVLGDMLELGATSVPHHHTIGEFAAEEGVDILVTLGREGAEIGKGAAQNGLPLDRLFHADDHKTAANIVFDYVATGDVILVKGSRGMGMEHIVKQLQGEEE